MITPKKSLGQHFLHDKNIARKIVDECLKLNPSNILEIGPGKGTLTQFLLDKPGINLWVNEIDTQCTQYLKNTFKKVQNRIITNDFLKLDLNSLFKNQFSIIGNLPYNISSQIFFKILEFRNKIENVVCMVQKEVADRIISKEGNKIYGILSVLLQAFYQVEFLFQVNPSVFIPQPKVNSAVISLRRNDIKKLDCDESLFFKIVKMGFNQRRKTLKNSLRPLLPEQSSHELLQKRPEQLNVKDFINLTNLVNELIK
ncbi:16S rRNA (adenine(1518)-N(6)/adenine(1519)-N(6))-dimethyltransferase RsmA [Bacteroidota bacterium]